MLNRKVLRGAGGIPFYDLTDLISPDSAIESRDFGIESRDFGIESRDFGIESRDFEIESRAGGLCLCSRTL